LCKDLNPDVCPGELPPADECPPDGNRNEDICNTGKADADTCSPVTNPASDQCESGTPADDECPSNKSGDDQCPTGQAEFDACPPDGTDADGNTCSFLINTSDAAETITDLASKKTVITTDSDKYTVADDATVYKYDTDDKEYMVSKLSAIDEGDTVSLYDTKGRDADGIASVVIYIAN
jgi:hypothetical protein